MNARHVTSRTPSRRTTALRRVCLAGLATLPFTSPLRAQSPDAGPARLAPGTPVTTAPDLSPGKPVTVLGLGLMTCQNYAALQNLSAADVANQWMLGFLSGGGAFASSNYLGGTSISDALKLVQHYCATNPTAVLAKAGLEVAQELEGPVGQMRKP